MGTDKLTPDPLEGKLVLLTTEPSAQFESEGILIFCTLPQNIVLVPYINDTMLSRTSEQKAATTLDLLVVQLCIRGGEVGLTKLQGLSTLVKSLGVQACRACRDILSVKDKYLEPPTSEKAELVQWACLDSESSKFLVWVYSSSPDTK